MSEPINPPPVNPEETPAWRSYLAPGTNVLRNLGELTDPAAVAIFERMGLPPVRLTRSGRGGQAA